MPEKIEGTPPPQEGEKNKSDLNQVFQILRSDAMEGQQMMCQRMGDALNFYTLFASEQAAQSAYDRLVQLGQQPKLEGRKVFLAAQFPRDEIDKLAKTSNGIPERKE